LAGFFFLDFLEFVTNLLRIMNEMLEKAEGLVRAVGGRISELAQYGFVKKDKRELGSSSTPYIMINQEMGVVVKRSFISDVAPSCAIETLIVSIPTEEEEFKKIPGAFKNILIQPLADVSEPARQQASKFFSDNKIIWWDDHCYNIAMFNGTPVAIDW
jgi:hypothetical protein